jgi:tetratricopeptide (TPR) repeat protein
MTKEMNVSRRAYEQLLVALHKEMLAGQGDEEPADKIREAMEAPWYALEEQDKPLLKELSADLYMIEGEEITLPLAEGEQAVELVSSASDAFQRQEWRSVLSVLRKLRGPWPLDVIAYVRGRCWGELGFYESALCFYEFAQKLSPSPAREALVLDLLRRLGSIGEALLRVETIEASPGAHPNVLAQAVFTLSHWARELPPAEAKSVRERLLSLAERLPASAEGDMSPWGLAGALLEAGFSAEHLGDRKAARAWLDRAVRAHESGETLVSRGLFLLQSDLAGAMTDFKRAIALGTNLVWPYFYLAHDALTSGRFEACTLYCRDGIYHAPPGRVRARLYEWWAIATFELERASGEVVPRFQWALADDPLDLTIEGNYRTYRSHSTQQSLSPTPSEGTSPSGWPGQASKGPASTTPWDTSTGVSVDEARRDVVVSLEEWRRRRDATPPPPTLAKTG